MNTRNYRRSSKPEKGPNSVIAGLPDPERRLITNVDAYKSDLIVFNRYRQGKPMSFEVIRDFLQWASENRAPATVARYKVSLKSALRFSLGSAMTTSDALRITELFSNIRLTQSETKVSEAQVLSQSELKAMQKKAGDKTRLLLQALYETGARVSEIIRLRHTDCQLIRGVYYCKVIGKGRKQRTVYLLKKTYAAICEAYGGKSYLWETSNGHLSRFTAHRLIQRAGMKVGRQVHPHTLRHSRATDLLKSGQSLPAVAAYLGNSSPAVTAQFYLHDLPSPEKIMGLGLI